MHVVVFLKIVMAGAAISSTARCAASDLNVPGDGLDTLNNAQTDSIKTSKIGTNQPQGQKTQKSRTGFWNVIFNSSFPKSQVALEFGSSDDRKPSAESPHHHAGSSEHLAYGGRRIVSSATTNKALLVSLINELSHELDNCTLVIIHDPLNEQLAKSLMEEAKLEFRPRAVFSLRNMTPQEASLMPQGFTSLKATSCINYLMIVSDVAEVQSVLLVLFKRKALQMTAKFVVISGTMTEEDIIMFLKSSPLDHIRNVLLVSPTISGLSFQLSTHSFFSAAARVELHILGYWGPRQAAAAAQGKKRTSPKTFFPKKLKNFHGHQLNVSTFNYPPLVIWDPNDSCSRANTLSNTVCADGLEVRILKAIQETLNFNAWLQMPKDGELWGGVNDDGNWSGAFGEMQRGEVDVSFGNFFITKERLESMDMTRLYSIDYSCFITLISPPPPQYTVVVRPFHYVVWMCLVASLVLMMPFLLLSARRVPADQQFRDLGISSMFVWGIQLAQSIPDQIMPSSAPLRVCFIFFSMSAFIVSVAYRSSLFSYILVPAAPRLVNTLQQLLKSGLKWGVRTSGGWATWFSDSTDPITRKIYEGFQYVKGIHSGIERVQNGDFAFMNSGTFLRYLVASNFTDVYGQAKLHVSRECFVPFRVGLGTPSFSVYTASFNTVVSRLVEAGLVTKWFTELLEKAAQQQRTKARAQLGGVSDPSEDSSSTVLGLYHLQGVFALLALGYGLSVLVFISEVAARRLRSQHDYNTKPCTDDDGPSRHGK